MREGILPPKRGMQFVSECMRWKKKVFQICVNKYTWLDVCDLLNDTENLQICGRKWQFVFEWVKRKVLQKKKKVRNDTWWMCFVEKESLFVRKDSCLFSEWLTERLKLVRRVKEEKIFWDMLRGKRIMVCLIR